MSRIEAIVETPDAYFDLLSDSFVIIERYVIGDLLDFKIPMIWTKSDYGEVRVPLFGDTNLLVSSRKYCTLCFSENYTETYICSDCLQTDTGALYRCIWNGPLLVYGRPCNLNENPLCGSFENASYCAREQLLYIGMFRDLIKVGATRVNRENSSNGYIDRFLEQGLDAVVIFYGSLDLPRSRELEYRISTKFGFAEKINFFEKVKALGKSVSREKQVSFLSRAAGKVLETFKDFGLEGFEVLYLRDNYIFPGRVDYAVGEYNEIVGRIVGFQGGVLFVRRGDYIVAYNGGYLVGRRIVAVI